MNANVVRALYKDALAQVIDNRVFRILVVLLLVFVVPTFLIGAREEELVVMFFWRYRYDQVFALIGQTVSGIDHPNRALIQAVQSLLIDGLAGGLGILFGIAATAFFVPRMLEKGAADVVFSKPVSRLALLLSRYVAGLLFAGILATLMIGGIQIGLLLNSGWSDPGFLWSIPTLIYVFGIVHAVSMLVGVVTRSSVAAILVTLLFYSFNGCVHRAWMVKESNFGRNVVEKRDGASVPQPPEDEESAGDTSSPAGVWRMMSIALDVVHYALPKTSEADLIARSARRGLDYRAREYVDGETDFSVVVAPEGFAREGSGSIADGGVAWISSGGDARIVVSRRRPAAGEDRLSAAKAIEREAESRPGSVGVDRRRANFADRPASAIEWTEERDGRTRLVRVCLFQEGEWLFRVDYDADKEWADQPGPQEAWERFTQSVGFGDEVTSETPGMRISSGSAGAFVRWEKRFGWFSPMPYNFFFSIGSTLAFVVAVLALAQWRLSRIDF